MSADDLRAAFDELVLLERREQIAGLLFEHGVGNLLMLAALLLELNSRRNRLEAAHPALASGTLH